MRTEPRWRRGRGHQLATGGGLLLSAILFYVRSTLKTPAFADASPSAADAVLTLNYTSGTCMQVVWSLGTVTVRSHNNNRALLLSQDDGHVSAASFQDPKVTVQTEKFARKLISTVPAAPVPDRPCKRGKDLPRLISIHEWRTRKERPRESVTLMTQLSVDRMSMLENQCRTWPDPLVAVVYVPLFRNGSEAQVIVPTYTNTTLDDALRGLDAFFMFMEATAQCALRMEVVGQFLDPLNPEEYPINSLRNRAIAMADTNLVFMLDVDFVATADFGLPSPGYRDPAVYNQMVALTVQKRALVLPAFEITNRKQELAIAQNFARSMVVGGKALIRENYLSGKVDAFNGQDAPWGHGPTNTSKWIALSRPITYRAYYEPRYEPFLVMNRAVAPWCDERFIGYGGNKIAFINQLQGMGFSFHVHPFGFVIHVPHVRTRAANVFVQEKRRGASQMDDLRARVEAEVAEGKYVPHTVFCQGDEAVEEEVEVEVDAASSSQWQGLQEQALQEQHLQAELQRQELERSAHEERVRGEQQQLLIREEEEEEEQEAEDDAAFVRGDGHIEEVYGTEQDGLDVSPEELGEN